MEPACEKLSQVMWATIFAGPCAATGKSKAPYILLDVTIKDDLRRWRAGDKHCGGVTLAPNLICQAKNRRAFKRHRKIASWNHTYLADILGTAPHEPRCESASACRCASLD